MTIPEKLKRLAGMMSPTKLSRRTGLGLTSVHSYINGRSIPRADSALALARGLGVDVQWLLDDSRGWPPVWIDEVQEVEKSSAA